MTGITPEGLEIDRDFAAPPSAVFAAWTTAEHFACWFGGKEVQIPADRLDYEPTAGWQTFFDVLQQIAEAA